MRAVIGRRALDGAAASSGTISRFETETLTRDENIQGKETMVMKKTVVIIVIAVLVAAGIGVGIWLIVRQPAKYSGPVEKVTIAAYEGEVGFLTWVAEDKGYFEEYGIDATVEGYDAGSFCLEALVNGEADVCTAADSAFVARAFDNPDIRIFGVIDEASDTTVIARKDSGINEPSDLKGKKIGITMNTTGEYFLSTFLTFNGLSLDDVEMVELKPKEMPEALASGDVDAVVTWQPNAFNAEEKLGDNAVSWSAQSGQDYYFLLIGTEKWLKENPELAERLLLAVSDAALFVAENEQEAKKTMARVFKYEPSYVEAVWDMHKFTVSLPQALITTMEDSARWSITNKLTEKTTVPNFLEFIDIGPMEKANPDAVLIIR